jgi:hypothetical protein
MGSERTRAGTRRRILFTGLAAGLVAGAAMGASLLSGASSGPGGPRPLVLHAAPAVVEARNSVALTFGTFCEAPETASCEVVSGTAMVQPAGVAGWSRIDGTLVDGVYRFVVPGDLIPDDGFSYWFEVRTADGAATPYPPGGADGAVRVVTTAGLPARSLPTFAWNERRAGDAVVARLRFGDGPGQVGVTGGGEEQTLDGPSSFDVAPDGSIYVADWVNGRIQVLSAKGAYRDSLPYPQTRPGDLAVTPEGGLLVSTLGAGAEVVQLTPRGAVESRFPVAYGIATRVAHTAAGPRVMVGPGQWAAVSLGRGIPLGAEEQARAQTTSIPLADGRIAMSDSLSPKRIAFVWTRPDGSRAGAVVKLPGEVLAGSDYLVRPMPDGGAIAVRGLWDQTHYGIAVMRFDAAAKLASFSLLPAPSTRMAAHTSVVRYQAPGRLFVAFDEGDAIRIDRFDVR